MLSSIQIRNKFTEYFIKNGHEKIESSPLIPQNDPTLLFANAGMNQFKDYFTGKANPKNKRAVTIQKCVRAGGKHNDLENVGFTARHHTFFEMLGNFSFGDYFKKEAIAFSWKFLTQELNIPKEKLYITVHETDEEARMIWHQQEGIPLERIFYMGDKDNFWEMGDIGPCGPCSEIFYDHGPEYSDGADTSSCLLNDEGRYVEIWNLVFMQYEKYKDEDGQITRRELPKPSVDTGAGLERLAACLQGVYWNYDIDGFKALIKKIEVMTNSSYQNQKEQTSIRVVCDHIRAATMLITDGVIPSNEGRGYVLRRIIRRAVRHLNELGMTKPSFHLLVPIVFEELGNEYPQNKANADLAIKMLKLEEEKFRQTLKTGLELLHKEIKKIKPNNVLEGEVAFKLYDTYGFPVDLTETILNEKNLKLDISGFEQAMKKQKENSKSSSQFSVQSDNLEHFYKVRESSGKTKFIGYHNLKSKSKLIDIQTNPEFTTLIFDQTPFYAEGGGQVGDTGQILSQTGEVLAQIVDTQSPIENLTIHICKSENPNVFSLNHEYLLAVDKEKRELTKRNHSATHLLQAALIEVLGPHIKQAGSRVSADSLRFDFTQPEALSYEQIQQVENIVNEKIAESLEVNDTLMSKDEATAKGAMALFGEKYGEMVRVLEMGDFSLELCGGTHVENTNEIGLFTITTESSLSSGVRRIEALTSTSAFKYLNTRSTHLSKIEKMFSAKSDLLFSKLKSVQSELKAKNKEIQALKDQIQAQSAKSLFDNKENLSNNLGLVTVNLKDGSPKDFRSLSDKFIDQNDHDVLLMFQEDKDKLSYLIRTHKKNKNINCSQILKTTQEIVSGRGGGRPDMAQGSGSAKHLEKFINAVKEELEVL
ncbi:MAG: alanine--tRNA ligase [Bacteriovoracaceae bacterium]|jgi:alanyl-tRNA synthetase|nr:alanine--tRNA ligase [Bacteriovoracaceae bacterium]